MDSVPLLVDGVQHLTIAKCLVASTITLTLYDYLLTFNDEVRYVWKARKAWASSLYIVNRILLTGYQVWMIHHIGSPRNSKTMCIAGYYIQLFSITFFLFASDIFVMLRVYAITFKNRILTVYLGVLMLTRMASPFVTAFVKPPKITALPLIPIDPFNLCEVNIDLELMLIPNSIGTAFEISAFLSIVWYTYHIRSSLKFSVLIRTIVTEATIYFLAMVAMQTYVLLSLIFMEGTVQQLSFLMYGSLNPILTMRFAISLKRSADRDSWRERNSMLPSPVNFAGPSPDTEVSAICENIEMDPIEPQNHQVRAREP